MKKTGKTSVNWKVQGIFFLGCMALLFLVLLIDPNHRGVVIWGGFFLTIAAILGGRLIRSPPGTTLKDALRPRAAVPDSTQKPLTGQNSLIESTERVFLGDPREETTTKPLNGDPADPAPPRAKKDSDI